jgi:hypothetical protein
LLLAVHEVVEHQGPVGGGEELAESHTRHRRVAVAEPSRALFEHIVLDRRTRWEPPSQRCHPLALSHQFNVGLTQLFPLGQVERGFLEVALVHVDLLSPLYDPPFT